MRSVLLNEAVSTENQTVLSYHKHNVAKWRHIGMSSASGSVGTWFKP